MIRILITIRFLWITLLVLFPSALVGFTFFGLNGAIVGASVMFVILLAALFGSERNLRQICKVEQKVPSGLLRTYSLALGRTKRKVPHLEVYSDPFPRIFIARSFGGRGTILLSQGMISLMNDEELKSLLGRLVEKTRSPAVVFRSFCATLAAWALFFAPKAWKDLVFSDPPFSQGDQKLLTPMSALKSILPFSLAILFYKMGIIRRSWGQTTGSTSETQFSALRKLDQSVRFWGSQPTHGVLSFYLSASHF